MYFTVSESTNKIENFQHYNTINIVTPLKIFIAAGSKFCLNQNSSQKKNNKLYTFIQLSFIYKIFLVI